MTNATGRDARQTARINNRGSYTNLIMIILFLIPLLLRQDDHNTNLMIKYYINKLNYFLFELGKKYKHCHSYASIF